MPEASTRLRMVQAQWPKTPESEHPQLPIITHYVRSSNARSNIVSSQIACCCPRGGYQIALSPRLARARFILDLCRWQVRVFLRFGMLHSIGSLRASSRREFSARNGESPRELQNSLLRGKELPSLLRLLFALELSPPFTDMPRLLIRVEVGLGVYSSALGVLSECSRLPALRFLKSSWSSL